MVQRSSQSISTPPFSSVLWNTMSRSPCDLRPPRSPRSCWDLLINGACVLHLRTHNALHKSEALCVLPREHIPLSGQVTLRVTSRSLWCHQVIVMSPWCQCDVTMMSVWGHYVRSHVDIRTSPWGHFEVSAKKAVSSQCHQQCILGGEL